MGILCAMQRLTVFQRNGPIEIRKEYAFRVVFERFGVRHRRPMDGQSTLSRLSVVRNGGRKANWLNQDFL